MFAPLPLAVIELLATDLEPQEFLPTLMGAAPDRNTVTSRACPDIRTGRDPGEPHDTRPCPPADRAIVTLGYPARAVLGWGHTLPRAPGGVLAGYCRILREGPECRLPHDSLYVAC
jgi:hypothetical protein